MPEQKGSGTNRIDTLLQILDGEGLGLELTIQKRK